MGASGQAPEPPSNAATAAAAQGVSFTPGTKRFQLWASDRSRHMERAPRYLIVFDVEVKQKRLFSSTLLGSAETVDISITGAKLIFPTAIGFGTKLLITVNDFSSKEFLPLTATVVRCRRNYVGGARYPVFEIGVCFRNMNPRKASKLMSWIQRSGRYGTQTFAK